MPIKIQSDLPAREILEKRTTMTSVIPNWAPEYPPIADLYSESDAGQTGYGAAASSVAVQYAAAGGRDLYEDEQPPVAEYLCNAFE